MPIMIKDETGEIGESEIKEMERLQFRIDYQELFISKMSTFQMELEGKVEYAQAEFDHLTKKSEQLIKQFGFDPSVFKETELFELMFQFGSDFADAYKRLTQKADKEEEKVKREIRKRLKGVRATVGGPDDTEDTLQQIAHWRELLSRAEDLQWFGEKKKEEKKKEKQNNAAPIKKATKIMKREDSNLRQSQKQSKDEEQKTGAKKVMKEDSSKQESVNLPDFGVELVKTTLISPDTKKRKQIKQEEVV